MQWNIPNILTVLRIALIPLFVGIFYLPKSSFDIFGFPAHWVNLTAAVIFAAVSYTHLDVYKRQAVVWIALAGLVVNLIVAWQLHHQAHHHGENLNNQAAYLHVIGDVIGSVAAIAAGAIIYFTNWQIVDPILSLLSLSLIHI